MTHGYVPYVCNDPFIRVPCHSAVVYIQWYIYNDIYTSLYIPHMQNDISMYTDIILYIYNVYIEWPIHSHGTRMNGSLHIYTVYIVCMIYTQCIYTITIIYTIYTVYIYNRPFIRVPWLMHTCYDLQPKHHRSTAAAKSLSLRMCAVESCYLCNDPFIHVPWLMHTWHDLQQKHHWSKCP